MIEEVTDLQSADHVLQALSDSPSKAQLEKCLDFLTRDGEINILVPGPVQSRIINLLVSKTIPDFYDAFHDDEGFEKGLLHSLTSVPGLGAIVARLKTLIKEQRQSDSRGSTQESRTLLNVLSTILNGADHVGTILSSLHTSDPISLSQSTLLWKEYVSLTAGGRITSTAAEARTDGVGSAEWLADGMAFAKWLGKGVGHIAVSVVQYGVEGTRDMGPASQLCSRSLSFGYMDKFLATLVDVLCIQDVPVKGVFPQLVRSLRNYEQRKILDGLMTISSNRYLVKETGVTGHLGLKSKSKAIGAVIALLKEFINSDEHATQQLCEWIADPQRLAVVSPATVRAVIATIAEDQDKLEETLSKIWEQWANQLFIRHASTAQQNALTQALLLAAGYVHRAAPMYLFTVARSSVHTHGLSNRLASTSTRIRWLGMVAGMAISACVDKTSNKLDFDSEDMQTEEAKWYRELVHVKDEAGNIKDLQDPHKDQIVTIKPQSRISLATRNSKKASKEREPVGGPPKLSSLEPAGVSIPPSLRIVELDDTDDLVPYAKPDSDPEDDSVDATMVNRNRPKPPIYIRDLIAYLIDRENIERRTLALQTAPRLIARKTAHGKEVTDHLEELATVIAGLSDGETFDLDDEEFARLRQKSLQAVLVADAKKMGPWFAKAIFNVTADYSVAQRMGLLIATGLGGRQLAGYKDDEAEDADMFPSKRLKGKMHDIWAAEPKQQTRQRLKPMGRAGLLTSTGGVVTPSAVDRVTTDLERTMLEPLALDAADKLTGPDVLKVRKFSSRMDVERKKVRPKANELSKIITDAFFFPLTGYFSSGVQTRLSGSAASFNKYLLPTYLRTLSLLLHSAGPSTNNLPTLTTEFWDILLGVRSVATTNAQTLEALLFSLLTILELNTDKHDDIVKDHAKELIETQEWARMVLDGAPSGGSEEEDKVKMLAAGVLVRCSEIVQKYQRRLLGDMVDV